MLRRNIHRLEKGLTMKVRREVFAQDYITETISSYCNLEVNETNVDSAQWFTNVLMSFFEVSKMNELNSKLSNVFFKSTQYLYFTKVDENDLKEPFLYGERSTNVTFTQLRSLVNARHSVRWYSDKIVARNVIDECILLSSKAPSACNRQPFKYIVLDTNEKASAVAELAMGTGGFSHNIQNLIAVVGDLSAYPFERDRHVIYIDSSLSSMLLMLAFKSQGIDSCPINWPDIETRERKINKALNLKHSERVIMLLAFGYAESDALIPYSEKKSNFEISEYQ
jgi:nitroreductase